MDIINDFINWFYTLNLPRVKSNNDMKNRKKYITYSDEAFYCMLSSTYRYIDDKYKGWCLDIVQIEVNDKYRNQGITTSILTYLKNNIKCDFIYVECVHSDILKSILRKLGGVEIIYLNSWIIQL